jgi:hypothetical protein
MEPQRPRGAIARERERGIAPEAHVMPSKLSRPQQLRPSRLVPRLALILAGGVLAVLPCASTFAAGFSAGQGHGIGFHYTTGPGTSDGRADFQYALIGRNSNTTCTVGDGDAWSTIGELQREVDRTGREVLWFAIDDRAYVVREAAALERARDIVEPMSRLGAEQGRLGAKQGELGRRQGEMGALQGRLGGIQGRLAGLQLVDDPRYRSEIDELRQQAADISPRLRELSLRQRALGEQQRELGRRQHVLGEEQRRASALATDQLRSLAERAIESGRAERIESR